MNYFPYYDSISYCARDVDPTCPTEIFVRSKRCCCKRNEKEGHIFLGIIISMTHFGTQLCYSCVTFYTGLRSFFSQFSSHMVVQLPATQCVRFMTKLQTCMRINTNSERILPCQILILLDSLTSEKRSSSNKWVWNTFHLFQTFYLTCTYVCIWFNLAQLIWGIKWGLNLILYIHLEYIHTSHYWQKLKIENTLIEKSGPVIHPGQFIFLSSHANWKLNLFE